MSENLRGLPIPEECKIYNEMFLEWMMKKAQLWDNLAGSSVTEYIVKLESQISKCKEEVSNCQQLLKEIKETLPELETK